MDFIKYLQEHKINLNEQQIKAVLSIDGPMLLLAVPGSGKTTVIVSRIANMITNHNIDPKNILTLTFSRSSANDMKYRFKKFFNKEIADLKFSTIHSFCYGVIQRSQKKINLIEGDNAQITKAKILRSIYKEINSEFINEDKLDELSNQISYVKNMMLDGAEIDTLKTNIDNFKDIYNKYESIKSNGEYLDFDDLLIKTYQMFSTDKKLLEVYRINYKYINIDEAQDTSKLQHKIIELLAKPNNNIFMVGDEDQSIYGFRAAYPDALLEFSKVYSNSQILKMERNYRSTKNIVNSANLFIKQNKNRFDKNMYSQNDEGLGITFTTLEDLCNEYDYLAKKLKDNKNLGDTAILYRNNVSAIPLIDILDREKVSFYIRDSKLSSLNHWVIKDVIAFIKLAINPCDFASFSQIYFKLNSYISKELLEYVKHNKGSKNIFDTLSGATNINNNQQKKIYDLKINFISLSRLKPLAALSFIQKDLEYEKYLKGDKSKQDSSTYIQILNAIKVIARNSESLDDVIQRLNSLPKICEAANSNYSKNAVTLTTYHSSKGLEFDSVYMIDLIQGQIPSYSGIEDKTLMEEEVRLFYVGITRAKRYVELITSSFLNDNYIKISEFAKYLKEKCCKGTKVLQKSKLEDFVDLNNYNLSSMTQDNLKNDTLVFHDRFGIGKIKEFDKDFVTIEFYNSGLKSFSLSICISQNLIDILEESNLKSS